MQAVDSVGSVDEVREFWEDRARSVGAAEEVTHRDVWQRWLEIEHLKRLVQSSDRVIDIGCGNGYTTLRLAPLVREIVGVDYSEEMVRRADEALRTEGVKTPNARFAVMDVLNLGPERFGRFDVAITERCLINLPGWPEQKRAIANIAGVLVPGGRYLFIEGSQEGRARLNELRQSVGLEPMPPVWHNRDFQEGPLLEFVEQYFEVRQRLHLGIYDLIARVAHPLMVAPAQPDYKARINRAGAEIALHCQGCGEISRVLFLVLRRK